MKIAYLSLGSNLDSPARQLRLGIKALRSLPSTSCLKIAPLYFNPAVGRKAQPDFYNTAVKLKTRLAPHALLSQCQHIESQRGRVRRVKGGARTLDIDILQHGSTSMKTPRLTLPHPRMLERDFVTVPLEALLS